MEQFLTLLNSNSSIYDLIFVALFIIAAIIGFKRGFYKTVAPLVITVCSFAAAIFGSSVLEGAAYDIVYPIFETEVNRRVEMVLENVSADSSIMKALVDRVDVVGGADKIAEQVVRNVVHFALPIVIFLIGLLVFNLISKLLERIVSFHLVTTFDGVLGGLYGILVCFVIIFIIIRGAGLLNVDFFTKNADKSMILDWILKL